MNAAIVRKDWIIAALMIGLPLWIYSPSLGGGWLWDDGLYITENPLLRSLTGLWRIWFAPTGVNYFPVTMTVQWLQWHLWHLAPFGYRMTNLLLHITSGFLFWRLLAKFGLKTAWLGGFLLVIHPVAVESVAWISEIKNTLSLPCLILAVTAYVDYADKGRRADYWQSLGWFGAAMLSKSTVAAFPVLLLLYVWRRTRRLLSRDGRRLLPFFLVSVALGTLTVVLEHRQMPGVHGRSPGELAFRMAGAGTAGCFYLSKALIPMGLLPLYSQWPALPESIVPWLPFLAMAAFVIWLCLCRTDESYEVLFAFGWFILGVAPLLGFVAMAYLRLAPVADHFNYVSLLGPLGLATGGFDRIFRWRTWMQPLLWTAIFALVSALALVSHRYAKIFVNEDALWSYAVSHNASSWAAHFHLANVRRDEGRVSEAIDQYQQALRLKPDAAEVGNNLGYAYSLAGKPLEAIAEYEKMLRLKPDSADIEENLGTALLTAGRPTQAIPHLQVAANYMPDVAHWELDLGLALLYAGRADDALVPLGRASHLATSLPEVHNALGLALVALGRKTMAAAEYHDAIRLNPDLAESYDNLGNLLFRDGQIPAAIIEYRKAIHAKPGDAEAHNNLGLALTNSGHLDDAIREYQSALRLRPPYAEAHYNLGNALTLAGRYDGAITQYLEALHLSPHDAGIHLNLAIALLARGTPASQVAQELETALRLDPGNKKARKLLLRTRGLRPADQD